MHFIFTIAIGPCAVGLVATVAIAQVPEGSPVQIYETANTCLRHAAELSRKAHQKDLSDDRWEDIDDLLVRMEMHCDAPRFSDARALALEILDELNRE